MPIINGTFDTDLLGWEISNIDRIIWEDGKALFINPSFSGHITMSQTFIADNGVLTFDWAILTSCSCPETIWRIYLNDVIVKERSWGTGFGRPAGCYDTVYGKETIDIREYIGKTIKLEISVGSPTCYGFNMYVDNVILTDIQFFLGNLYVESNPSGASIFIDGIDTTQITPATIENIFEGTYELKLILTNYEEYITNITMIGRETINVMIDLTPYGSLYVESNPPGASIFIDDVDTTQITPATIENIRGGTHELKLILTDYKEYVTYFTIIGTETINISAYLIPYGKIIFISTPEGADIYINGEYQGQTPLTVSNVSEGSYEYILRLSDYYDYPGSISISEGETVEISTNLIFVDRCP